MGWASIISLNVHHILVLQNQLYIISVFGKTNKVDCINIYDWSESERDKSMQWLQQ